MKDLFLDSIQVYDHNTGRYCCQSHKCSFYVAHKEMKFIGSKSERPMDSNQSGNMPVLR